MDLIMGRFADAALVRFSEHELDEFERLVEVPDPDLLSWIIGEGQVPADLDSPVFRQLCAFHRGTDIEMRT
jgi:antitoxin CptB